MTSAISQETAPWWSSFRRHWYASLVAFFGFAATCVILLVPSLGRDLASVSVLSGTLTAGVLMVRKARMFEDRERQAWAILGGAFLIAAVGVVIGGLVEVITGSAPTFGPLDVFFVTSYVFVMVGVLRFPHIKEVSSERVRVLIDGIVGSVSLGTILWVWFLDDLFAQLSNARPIEQVIGMSYAIGDLAVMAVLAILILRRSALRFDIRLVPIFLGFTAQTIADITFVIQGAGRTFAEAEPLWWAFPFAMGWYTVAAILMHNRPPAREYADRHIRWLPMLAPYATAAVLVAMLVYQVGRTPQTPELRVMLAATLVVALGVIARQVVAIRENRERVEKERGSLISSISHELRTPLTAMVGFLDVLTDPTIDLPDDDREEMLSVVQDQAGYMASIVSDMVLLARGRLNQMHLSETVVRMADISRKAQLTLDAQIEELGVDVDPDLYVRIDADRIQQVIVNYLTNAARYGGPRVELIARTIGGTVHIEVHDDGPGVPKRYELSVWERFERGANRFNATVPGSGIGLAIVSSIAEAHGGSADYRRSERLGGACFSISLPDRVAVEETRQARTRQPRSRVGEGRLAV